MGRNSNAVKSLHRLGQPVKNRDHKNRDSDTLPKSPEWTVTSPTVSDIKGRVSHGSEKTTRLPPVNTRQRAGDSYVARSRPTDQVGGKEIQLVGRCQKPQFSIRLDRCQPRIEGATRGKRAQENFKVRFPGVAGG